MSIFLVGINDLDTNKKINDSLVVGNNNKLGKLGDSLLIYKMGNTDNEGGQKFWYIGEVKKIINPTTTYPNEVEIVITDELNNLEIRKIYPNYPVNEMYFRYLVKQGTQNSFELTKPLEIALFNSIKNKSININVFSQVKTIIPNNLSKYTSVLLDSYNLILHGAPGTGKTFLTEQIAEELCGDTISSLKANGQYQFIQFHPSYDYTDFVSGYKPDTLNENPTFKVKNGTFVNFILNAYVSKQFSSITIFNNFKQYMQDRQELVLPIENNQQKRTYVIKYEKQNKIINAFDDQGKDMCWDDALIQESIRLNLINEKWFVGGAGDGNVQGFRQRMIKYIIDNFNNLKINNSSKKYVFVIDEINRAEISKVFGELFFAIDPSYRGEKGVKLQYGIENNANFELIIPKNVYIIGTMNDIDRSVDTFDFAMKRRFAWMKIDPIDTQNMINNSSISPKEQEILIRKMNVINQIILGNQSYNNSNDKIDFLSEDYQIGASYFLNYQKFNDFNILWNVSLLPLLKEYIKLGDFDYQKQKDVLNEIKKKYDFE